MGDLAVLAILCFLFGFIVRQFTFRFDPVDQPKPKEDKPEQDYIEYDPGFYSRAWNERNKDET